MPFQAAQDKPTNIAARELAPDDGFGDTVVTATHDLASYTTPAPPSKAGRTAYYPFTLSITEYCEASQGTPLMVRGYWSPKDSTSGMKITFEDGRKVTAIPIGYGNLLHVGTCKYPRTRLFETCTWTNLFTDNFWKHQVNFSYGGCHWNQDTIGNNNCGFCVSKPWTSGELNCATNPAAGRVSRPFSSSWIIVLTSARITELTAWLPYKKTQTMQINPD